MKTFKTYLTEEVPGTANSVAWHGAKGGSAVLTVQKKAFDKDPDAACLAVLKRRIPQARALTKLKADENTIKQAGGPNEGEYYLVRVDYSVKGLEEEKAKEGPPSNSERAKEKHDREKEQLKSRQDKENETAREADFRKKENDRRIKDQQRQSAQRAQKAAQGVNEYLEDGTDKLVNTYKKYVPGQE